MEDALMDTTAEVLTFGNPDLSEGTPERPLVTFALFAYNQEQYVRKAVEGAFSQTYSPLEVILSDDCSSDRTYEIMKELAAEYEGLHRVVLRRSKTNKGLLAHINSAEPLFSGNLVLFAAGDDISLAVRSEALVSTFLRNPQCMAIFSSYIDMDDNYSDKALQAASVEAGDKVIITTKLDHLMGLGGVGLGATYAYSRTCLKFPGRLPEHLYLEDRILPLRAAFLGSVLYEPSPLVVYRHPSSSEKVHEKTRITSSTLLLPHLAFLAGELLLLHHRSKRWVPAYLFDLCVLWLAFNSQASAVRVPRMTASLSSSAFFILRLIRKFNHARVNFLKRRNIL